MKLKVSVLMIAVTILLGFAACTKSATSSAGGSGTTASRTAMNGLPVTGKKSSHLNSSTEPIHIAFILYSWNDDQGQYIQQYGTYLSRNFNIRIEYVQAENSAEATIDTVESLVSRGVDGIVLANQNGFQSWAAICEANRVYYSIMLGQLDYEADRAFAATCKYFMGSLGNYDYTFLGEIYARHTIAEGYKKILITGASPGMQAQTDQMIAGYLRVIDTAGIEYRIARAGFNQLFTTVSAALVGDTYDIVYCPISMMNFAVSNIYANRLVGKTKTMGHGTSEDLEDAMDAGVVSMFSDNMTTGVGINVALIINAVEGNAYPDWPVNENVYIRAPSFVIQNEDDFAIYERYVRNYTTNPFLCDAETLMNMILSYNSNATFASIRDFVETMSLDKLRNR